ncbi:ABC transporter [Clostridium gasigenes]|uniref:ABC transporter n=1 Tax=Clostridium gasigenes TaxID=94869 RepID=A0A1H0UBP8_9CLOT|nr:ABC transporter [Clostridium gasigenes]
MNLELLNTFGLISIKNKQYEQLSTGQKRRLHLALALVNDPKVIFLDEPTAGLDVEGRIALHQAIRDLKKQGKTIILASHDMAEVEALCDRIAILKGGTIVFTGTTEEITSIYNNVVNIYVKTLKPISNSSFKYIKLINEESDYSIYSTSNVQEGLF